MSRLALIALLPTLILGACATRPMPPPRQSDGLERAVEQPIRDLSLLRDEAPLSLRQAWADPYRSAPEDNCASVRAEINELDAALGPDIGAAEKAASEMSAKRLASGAVESAVALPFRGVIRTVSGAERRDHALRAAVSAGMVRRGFLKGRQLAMACGAQAEVR